MSGKESWLKLWRDGMTHEGVNRSTRKTLSTVNARRSLEVEKGFHKVWQRRKKVLPQISCSWKFNERCLFPFAKSCWLANQENSKRIVVNKYKSIYLAQCCKAWISTLLSTQCTHIYKAYARPAYSNWCFLTTCKGNQYITHHILRLGRSINCLIIELWNTSKL